VSTAPVFLVEALPAGERAVLDGQEGRHAATVRRLRPGQPLVLSDGVGGTAECVVVTARKDSLDVEVRSRARESSADPAVTLAQALIKGDRGELAVEMATEAGVDEIVPWRAARCVAKWEQGARGDKALARWRNSVAQAAKQARRAWVPAVAESVSTESLLGRVRAADVTLVLHESAERGLGEIELPQTGTILMIVGPEGGISDDEISALVGAGAVAVRLGHTVLRASTAATVALGAIGARTARWS
jgi:16S rRNA (uracil1498-N3)-methyltransferase